MLLDFHLGNYRSYHDVREFTLIASADNAHLDSKVTIKVPYGDKARTINVLTSAVIYGANASGKSNLLNGIKFMKRFIFDSSRNTQIDELIAIEPCSVSGGAEKEPSHFEVIFIHDGILYRYGFEVTRKKVRSEWLFFSPKGKTARLFVRDQDSYSIGKHFSEGKGLDGKTRDNALFLSVCAQFNGEISKKILNWFSKLNVISGIEDKEYLPFTIHSLNEKWFLEEMKNLMRLADSGIDNITFEQHEIDFSELPDEIKSKLVKKEKSTQRFSGSDDKNNGDAVKTVVQECRFLHTKFDSNKEITPVAFEEHQESQGTKKLFAIAGPIIDTLKFGKTLFIDELDARLHPLLTQYLIQLFNSRKRNPNNAQLIFTTHDTNLLSGRFFRRDQIWFTEKDKQNTTDLYSLSDFKVRKDASFNKDYIMGKYGAIPYISDTSVLFGDGLEKK